MLISICAVLIIIIFYIGYAISLHSLISYIDPEKMEQISGRLSGFRKKYLEEILENPRTSLQLTLVFKSLLLVLVTLLTILIITSLTELYGLRGDISYSIGLLVIWALYLIFIEILPRRRVFGLTGKETLRFLPLFVTAYMFFKPVVSLYGRVFARRKIKEIPEEQKEDIIERAIETLAEQAGVSEPIVEEDEKEMIGQIFQLDVTEVREVMVPRIDIKGIEKQCTIEDIKNLTKELGYSRYPVYEGSLDNIMGILYVKDLFTGFASEQDAFDVARYTREPYFVPEKKIIGDLLAEFKTNKVHIAIVVDEYGGTSGLVTLEDILEEIVGEIQDEHDFEQTPLLRLSDNSLRVDAGVSVEKLVEELNLDYETGEFETVGGLIYDLVGSVPAVDIVLRWKDVLFKVERVEGQRIISVRAWVKKEGEH